MKAVAQAGIRRVVHISSVAVYNGRGRKIDESAPQHQYHDNPKGWTVYSMSKAVSEQKAWALAQELRLQLTCIRPSAIYGAYDPNATRIFKRIWSKPISITVPGAVFPLVYAGDVAEAVASSLENERSIGQSYNTAGGQESLGSFYRGWKKAGLPSPKVAIPIPAPFIRFNFVNSKAEKDLGFKNRPFCDGLAETHSVEKANSL
jgi:nucleoside-diphosphate-sugar epimerase